MANLLHAIVDRVHSQRRGSLGNLSDSSPSKEPERRASIGSAQNSPCAKTAASHLLEAAESASFHQPYAASLTKRASPRWDGNDFSRMIQQFPTPTSLWLRKIEAPDFASLDQLKKLETLKSIVVEKANPTIISMLRNIELEELAIKDIAEFSDLDLINCNFYFFKVTLSHLSLQNLPSIKGNGLEGLVNFFKLSCLKIDSCTEFDDSGLQAICGFHGKLTTLHLENLPKITDEGLLPFIQLVQEKKLPLLQTVVIENCPGITETTRESLQKTLQENRS